MNFYHRIQNFIMTTDTVAFVTIESLEIMFPFSIFSGICNTIIIDDGYWIKGGAVYFFLLQKEWNDLGWLKLVHKQERVKLEKKKIYCWYQLQVSKACFLQIKTSFDGQSFVWVVSLVSMFKARIISNLNIF